MYCPRCASERLVESHRVEIEIDSCPSCRGIWLDRGELNKIVARLVEEQASALGVNLARRDHDDASLAPVPRARQDWLRDLFD